MEEESSSSQLQLCLTWNSFKDNILTSLESSYGDGDFVDVTLACEGESIKAHKLVLSACSAYLKRLLKDNPCSHPIIILNDIGLAELRDILSYMYHGEVKVEQHRIARLLQAAQLLEVRGLQDITQKLDTEDSKEGESKKHLRKNGDNQKKTSREDCTAVQSSRSPSAPPGKKARPIPMLQCIQPSSKADGSEKEAGSEDESNNSSVAPEHSVFVNEVQVKEEKAEISEQLEEFVTTHSTAVDDTSSETEREFNNGYVNAEPALSGGGGGGFLAAEMLKMVASRASNNNELICTPSLTSILLSQKDKGLPELHHSGALMDAESNLRKKNNPFYRKWPENNIDQQSKDADFSMDGCSEEDMDVQILSPAETLLQQGFGCSSNSNYLASFQFSKPLEQEAKGKGSFQNIEQMLNLSPQLRMQMLMCREYKKYTNILLVAMFGREMLATHSLNGTGTSKPKLNSEKVNHIIEQSSCNMKRKLAFHEPRPCPHCQRIYRDAATLRTHVTIMHKPGPEPFICVCGSMFSTKYHMYVHRKNGHK